LTASFFSTAPEIGQGSPEVPRRRGDLLQHGRDLPAREDDRAQAEAQGIHFTKLHFGRKLFVQIFENFWTKIGKISYKCPLKNNRQKQL
jgi:hypothetical protein